MGLQIFAWFDMHLFEFFNILQCDGSIGKSDPDFDNYQKYQKNPEAYQVDYLKSAENACRRAPDSKAFQGAFDLINAELRRDTDPRITQFA